MVGRLIVSYYDELCEVAADFERSESDWGEESAEPICVGGVWIDPGSPLYDMVDRYYSRRSDRCIPEMLDSARDRLR